MQISTRFTIATHILLCIGYFAPDMKVTSSFVAESVNVNPVVIRRTLGQLKAAGLVVVEAGIGGASLARPAEKITLLDIFNAVESVQGVMFAFHEHPNSSCPVGSKIHAVLDSELDAAQKALETRLNATTLADLLRRLSC